MDRLRRPGDAQLLAAQACPLAPVGAKAIHPLTQACCAGDTLCNECPRGR